MACPFLSRRSMVEGAPVVGVASDSLKKSIETEVNEACEEAIAEQFGMSRRTLMERGIMGAGGLITMSMFGMACKTPGVKSGDSAIQNAAVPPTGQFMAAVLAKEEEARQAAPLPSESDPDYITKYREYAVGQGRAVAGVIGFYLARNPYGMFEELLATDPKDVPFFLRPFGPAIIFRHPQVIDALLATGQLTVDPYASQMTIATDGYHFYSNPANAAPAPGVKPKYYSHYMLGTDNPMLYRPDGILLRMALPPGEDQRLQEMIRKICAKWMDRAKKQADANGGLTDLVTTVCRFSAVDVVHEYLGIPSFEEGEENDLGLRAGASFPLPADIAPFKFNKIQAGVIPTKQKMYEWVRDAFRNIFNNISPAAPKFKEFREKGEIATEELSAYVHLITQIYKRRIAAGQRVPDTMVTRLLTMQYKAKRDAAYGRKLAEDIGVPYQELIDLRLTDGAIRGNVFGTVVGAVANPEEGNGRVIDSALRLKEGRFQPRNGTSSFESLVAACRSQNADIVRKFALEGLRLQPQGEVLLRFVVRDYAINGRVIRAPAPPKPGEQYSPMMVFVAHGAAMRDPAVIQEPEKFDITRERMDHKYANDPGREKEAPQSRVYLQHGHGRHLCLGRYASEMTLQEVLMAVFASGNVDRALDANGQPEELKFDDDGIYATSLKVVIR